MRASREGLREERRKLAHLHLSTVHPHQPRDLDLLPRPRVKDLHPPRQRPLVDPHVCQLPKLALLQLERQPHQRRVRRRHQRYRRGSDRQRRISSDGLDLGRVRQIRNDSVEEGLNTRVLDGRSEHDGGERVVDGAATDALGDGGGGDGLLVEEEIGHGLVDFGELLDELCLFLFGERDELSGNLLLSDSETVRRKNRSGQRGSKLGSLWTSNDLKKRAHPLTPS
jgi:hypothetical protein